MKERLIKNIGLKIISLFIAFFLWMGVHNISNPEITRNKNVTLEVLNANIIKNAGKTYEVLGGDTVNISYTIRARDENRIKADDFKAYIDLANLYDVTGAVPINVEVTNHKELIIGQVVAKPTTVRVLTEDLQRKEFDIKTHITGRPKDGFSVGSVELTPKRAYINGPISLIGQISTVGVEINVDGMDFDAQGDIDLICYDANGNKLRFDDKVIYFEHEKTHYKINMLKGKTLDLVFDVSGKPASGYKFVGVTSNTKSVSVVGEDDTLNKIENITINSSDLDINGLTESKNIVIDVSKFLPQGITINSPAEVSVTMNIEAEDNKQFDLNAGDIKLVGAAPNLEYKIKPENLHIMIMGPLNKLEHLSSSDIQAEVDVNDMMKGSHIGKLVLKLPDGFELDSYTSFNVLVYDEEDKEHILSIYNKEDIQNIEDYVKVKYKKKEEKIDTNKEEIIDKPNVQPIAGPGDNIDKTLPNNNNIKDNNQDTNNQ